MEQTCSAGAWRDNAGRQPQNGGWRSRLGSTLIPSVAVGLGCPRMRAPQLVAQKESDKTQIPWGEGSAVSSANYPSLKGKRVVVTGGASGIGAALVAGFVGQGAETIFVDILDREAGELKASLGDAAIAPDFHRLDLRDLQAVDVFFRTIGPIDILVNNAASDDRHALENITP